MTTTAPETKPLGAPADDQSGTRAAAPSPRLASRSERGLLAAAVIVTALNLRTAVSGSGPLLSDVRAGVGMDAATAGLLTSLPMMCFAAAGGLVPRAAARAGYDRLLLAGTVLIAVGTLARGFAGSPWLFLTASALAFVGVALGNVLLPVMVRTHFADRVGPMTAAYTTVLAVGASASAALSVPLASWASGAGVGGPHDGWRIGVAAWCVPAAASAALAWRAVRRRSGAAGAPDRPAADTAPSSLKWSLTGYFAAQSLQAFVAMGWFAGLFRDAGATPSHAGYLIAFVSALSVPMSMLVPPLAARLPSQAPLVVALASAYAAAYVGLLAAPLAGAWLWALLLGVGSGTFPLALTLFSLRSRTPAETAALSGFAQSAGYALASTGPLAVGWLHRDGAWGPAFGVLFAALVQLVSGLHLSRDRRLPAPPKALRRAVGSDRLRTPRSTPSRR